MHLHAGLRDLEHGIGAENVVVRLVHLEQNLRPGGGGIPVLRGGAEPGCLRKIRGPAEVGDQLADAYAHRGAAGKTGSLERAGGNRRVRVGADGGEVARKQGSVCGPHLLHGRSRGLGVRSGGADSRMVAKGKLLGLLQGERAAILRGSGHGEASQPQDPTHQDGSSPDAAL